VQEEGGAVRLFEDLGDPLTAFFLGKGSCAEPPDSIPLRILELDELPATRDALQSAFRRRVMQLHPDLGAYTALPDIVNEAVALKAEQDPTVQEAKWARDILLHKVRPVTDGKSQACVDFSIRNKGQARIDELTVEIDKERADHPERFRWHRDRDSGSIAWTRMRELARFDCRWCGKCGRDLAADEPVWRVYEEIGGVQVRCDDCPADEWDRGSYARSECEQCGRPVRHRHAGYRRWYRTFCCELCRDRYQAAQRSTARADARARRRCEGCDELLDADRSDARYCSPACRQKAYRRRSSRSPA
jgi:hypothetical protein